MTMKGSTVALLIVALIANVSFLTGTTHGQSLRPARIVTFADVTLQAAVTPIRAANAGRHSLSCTNTSTTANARIGDGDVTATRGAQVLPGAVITIEGTAAVSGIREGATNVVVACTEELY